MTTIYSVTEKPEAERIAHMHRQRGCTAYVVHGQIAQLGIGISTCPSHGITEKDYHIIVDDHRMNTPIVFG